jgi:hypothetical protein
MIQVGVGQDDRVDLPRVEGERIAVEPVTSPAAPKNSSLMFPIFGGTTRVYGARSGNTAAGSGSPNICWRTSGIGGPP